MSESDRQWLEHRLQHMETRLREDRSAMETRITAQLNDLKTVTTTRLNDHSGRLRKLENWRSWIAGLSAAAGAAGGWVTQIFRDGR